MEISVLQAKSKKTKRTITTYDPQYTNWYSNVREGTVRMGAVE
ncbi:MAG: hypothetical protein AVDCRST_MAG93-7108 [uncultured Chloroflexia bacterium]|uniref:Uncharacterized protein n=1 Tax=uncultured Chloroflexia bacterium TaxID=1672391 RepID=A0A6J4M5J8_9CHLR|nr:MAG: hypothetical protein AVDCRST_MAG93-7108 [uncultured Chloroflexia bacterium]